MTSNVEIKRWLENELHGVLGMASTSIADYLIALGRKAKTETELYNSLITEGEIPENEKAKKLASELFVKIPKVQTKSQSDSVARKKEQQQKVSFLEDNQSFKLVLEDAPPKIDPSESKRLKRQKRSRENGKDEDDKKKKRKPDELLVDKELQRLQDIKERDELDARIRQRDLEKFKGRKSENDKEAEKEIAHRTDLFNDRDLREAVLPDLRIRSRQKYLDSREEQRLILLQRRIEDDELLFKPEEYTEKERKRLESDKELLRLVRERKKLEAKADYYQMPENYVDEKGRIDKEKKEALLFKRYLDTEDDKRVESEQEKWEKMQSAHANMGKEVGDVEEFNLLFDESNDIKFVLQEAKKSQQTANLDVPYVDEQAKKQMNIQEVKKSLPIYKYKDELLQAINDHQVLIIIGDTGSGKTTQIPQYLHEAGYTKNGKIGITQPRRVAAMSVASRVAEEMNTKIGWEVGYSIRFEDYTSDKTVIKYMTDGMLLREFLTEPDLNTYSVLIIDEAHERSLHTDILFGLVKDIARFRPNLKLLISSATMDADKFSEYFGYAPKFTFPGRRFPVETYYTLAPEANYLTATVLTIFTIHTTQEAGDILVFLTGQEEIEAVQEMIEYRMRQLKNKVQDILIAPIYANLPSDMQARIFETTPKGTRKVVLATNIAETSITIDGIVYVIDPGFVKQKTYSPRTGMESLVVVPCSKASANQRLGRAGRQSPGKCFRLYTSWAFENEMQPGTIPEIQRTNLGNVVLLLKSLGIDDLIHFDFMDPPPGETLLQALEQLYALGALNDKGELTKMGRSMAEFPMEPMLSKMLISSAAYGVSEEILSIASMLQVQTSIFFRPKDRGTEADTAHKSFNRQGGDHLRLLNIFNEWCQVDCSKTWCTQHFIQFQAMRRALDIREQLVSLMERVEVELKSSPNDSLAIRKAITSGFFFHAGRLSQSGDTYMTVKHHHTVRVHPSSSLFKCEKMPRCVLYYELVLTKAEYMRQVIEIEPQWLMEVAPHYYNIKEIEELDKSKKMPKNRNVNSAI